MALHFSLQQENKKKIHAIFFHGFSYCPTRRYEKMMPVWRHEIEILSTLLGLYSLSGKTSYRKISWSLEAARLGFKLFQSLCNLAGTSAALLPRCLSYFRAIRPLQHPISRLRDFTRFGGKTSYRLMNRGPGSGGFPSERAVIWNFGICLILAWTLCWTTGEFEWFRHPNLGI